MAETEVIITLNKVEIVVLIVDKIHMHQHSMASKHSRIIFFYGKYGDNGRFTFFFFRFAHNKTKNLITKQKKNKLKEKIEFCV